MLYIVATPIGNLDDISLRQARTLAISDIILAEDTRSAQILKKGVMERFQVTFKQNQQTVSYYKDVEFEKLPGIIEELQENKKISLISESGLPLFSDPGYLLVKSAIKNNIPFTVIPGPTAFTAAVINSGFKANEGMYIGFLPKKNNEIIKLFRKLHEVKKLIPELVIVFYESPKRINTTLQILVNDIRWNPDMAICREMTKQFEEILRGKAKDFVEHQFKGEMSIVIT